MKALLVGNCQVTPLAELLSLGCPKVSFTPLEAWKMTLEECAVFDPECFDLILSQPLRSAHYGALSFDNLLAREKCKPVFFIHNLHFEGVMPDCTYLGPRGKRISGPLGTYHSKSIVSSFCSRESIDTCISRMRRGAGIVHIDAWNKSIFELQTREKSVSIPFAEELVDYVKKQYCFHMFNHPSSFLLARYAEKIIARVFGKSILVDETVLPDRLAKFGSWATYEYLSKAVGLGYTQEHFLIPNRSAYPISLAEFTEFCYRSYKRIGASKLVR